MRPSTLLIVALVALGAAAMVRGARGADRHPAMTSDRAPGWQLQVALPGQDYKPRGRFFDNRTGCLLDLASDAVVQPKGTRLVCIRIDTKREAR